MPRGQVVPVKPISFKDDREEDKDPILPEDESNKDPMQEEEDPSGNNDPEH
ncbi:hypothetical protein [Rufibacter tibetensis]|uniref:hypothetical protein n=1 Tax=Rufibacter tibetensis TaxID=512763 RepID=UPI000AD37BD3|nr:hypothetical protein [Rufibacter tibetensis]